MVSRGTGEFFFTSMSLHISFSCFVTNLDRFSVHERTHRTQELILSVHSCLSSSYRRHHRCRSCCCFCCHLLLVDHFREWPAVFTMDSNHVRDDDLKDFCCCCCYYCRWFCQDALDVCWLLGLLSLLFSLQLPLSCYSVTFSLYLSVCRRPRLNWTSPNQTLTLSRRLVTWKFCESKWVWLFDSYPNVNRSYSIVCIIMSRRNEGKCTIFQTMSTDSF